MRRLFKLALTCFLLVTVNGYALSAAPAAYHLETAPAKHIRATLTDTWKLPQMTACQYAFFIPALPSLPSQDHTHASLGVDDLPSTQGEAPELSPLHRPVLWLRVAVPKHYLHTAVTAHVVYEAVLYSRRLVPGPPAAPVAPLSDLERRLNTRPSETIDFQSEAFQRWLSVNHLYRPRSESDLDFAYRVYQKIRKLYHYNYVATQDRRVSLLCQTNATDCGGLSHLFVAALRANGIPAHTLDGRMAVSATKPHDPAQCHVRSEFFADGIGWVPVDMSCGVSVSDKDAPRFFGNDPGDLLTMHYDVDFVLSPGHFGPQGQCFFQSIAHWVWGTGSFSGADNSEDWQVEELPLNAN